MSLVYELKGYSRVPDDWAADQTQPRKWSARTRVLCASLAVSALIPFDYFGSGRTWSIASPALWALIFFAGPFRTRNALGWALLTWFLISGLLSTTRSQSIVWALLLGGLLTLPYRQFPADAIPALKRTWAFTSAVTGSYAICEAVIWRANPIYGSLFANAATPVTQAWGTYRATATFGHPLIGATFISLGLMLGYQLWLRTGKLRWLSSSLLALGGLIACGGRGALLAAAIGLFLLIVGSLVTRAGEEPYRVNLLVRWLSLYGFGLAVLSLLTAGALREGREADGSAAAHLHTYEQSSKVIASALPTGEGPGFAFNIRGALGDNRLLESYWLETVVSVGIVGATLVALVVLNSLVASVRKADVEAVSVMLCALIGVSFWKAFTGHPPVTAWVALALAGVGCAHLSSSRRRNIPQTVPRED